MLSYVDSQFELERETDLFFKVSAQGTIACWFAGLFLSLFAACGAGTLAILRMGTKKGAIINENKGESNVDALHSNASKGIIILLAVALSLFLAGLGIHVAWMAFGSHSVRSRIMEFLLLVLTTAGFTFWNLRFTIKLAVMYM